MIYCVRYRDVEAYLVALGFRFIGEAEGQRVFVHPTRDPGLCSIHAPNPDDLVTELSVSESLHEAEIELPAWPVQWSD